MSNNEWAIEHLERFLYELSSKSKAKTIHLVAHSMGNRILSYAIHRFAQDFPQQTRRFQQIMLIAPDIDSGVLRQLSASITQFAYRTTLYASSNDRAMVISRKINGQPRAGDSRPKVLVLPRVDSIDVSAVNSDLIGHFYYGENRSVLSDMFRLIHDGSPPEHRFGLKPVNTGQARYWEFRP